MPGSSFTPDSKALITSFDGKLLARRGPVRRSNADPVHCENRTEARTEGPLRIPDQPRPRPRAADPVSPALPRRTKLAFTALDRLWVMDYPAGKPRRVSTMDAGEHQPAWAPDGRSIAYVSWSDADGGHVYRVAGRRRHPAKAHRRSHRSIRTRFTRPTASALSSSEGHGRAPGGFFTAGPRRPGNGAGVAACWWRRGHVDHAVPRSGTAALCQGSGAHLRVGRQPRPRVVPLRRHRREDARQGHRLQESERGAGQ